MSDTTGSNPPPPEKTNGGGGGGNAMGIDPAQQIAILQQQQMLHQNPAAFARTVHLPVSGVAPNAAALAGRSGTGGQRGVKSTQFIRRGEEGNDGTGARGTAGAAPDSGAGPRYVYRDFSHLPKESPAVRTTQAGAAVADDPGGAAAVPGDGMAPTIEEIKNAKLPAKLNHMLMDPSLQNIVMWMPHGRAWKILRPKDFTDIVLPRYFESVNYNSFVRLVNAWGFRRFTTGRDSNAYYHELFLKGMPHLHSKMRRLPKRARKAPISREDEPDFYALDRVAPLPGIDADKVRQMTQDHDVGLNIGPGAMPPNASSVGPPGMSSPSAAVMNEMAGMGGMGGMGQMPGQMNPMMMQNMMMNPMMFGQMHPMMMGQLNPMMMPGGGMMGMGLGMGQFNPMMMPGMGQMLPSGEILSLDGASTPGALAPSASGNAGGDPTSGGSTVQDAGTLEDQRLQARLALMRDERNLLEQEAALARKIAAQQSGGGGTSSGSGGGTGTAPVADAGATADSGVAPSDVPAGSDGQTSTVQEKGSV